jgi:DNA-binding MarR family transcriptional regulator
MTGLLAGLVRDAYVTREDDPNDGRKHLIQLTDKGADVIERVLVERVRHIEQVFACFSPSELADQCALIEKLNYQLEPAPVPN